MQNQCFFSSRLHAAYVAGYSESHGIRQAYVGLKKKNIIDSNEPESWLERQIEQTQQRQQQKGPPLTNRAKSKGGGRDASARSRGIT